MGSLQKFCKLGKHFFFTKRWSAGLRLDNTIIQNGLSLMKGQFYLCIIFVYYGSWILSFLYFCSESYNIKKARANIGMPFCLQQTI